MSVHETEPNLGKDIWNGKYWGKDGAVARHRKLYDSSRHTPQDDIAWMSTLYSALGRATAEARRGNVLSMLRAFRCYVELRPLVSIFAHMAHEREMLVRNLPPDQCETVSAILFRLSELPFGGWYELDAARTFAFIAYQATKGASDHTRALAALTLVRIGDKGIASLDAAECLSTAITDADLILDSNQRARVMRGIALLGIKHGYPKAEMLDYLDEADEMEIGDDVRFKNAEARREIEALPD